MSEMQRDGSEMRCKRCGANESRIHGFCSVECEHYFDYEEEITDLNARIAELEEKQRWIPVGERLPDNWLPVLTIDMSESVRVPVPAFYDPETSLWSTHFPYDLWVTHWMPLPPNPESPNDTQTQTIVYGKGSE
jgi:hypothetical protein